MPTVLSIQSWVACGNVGNTAALFPLQRLGCETWSLNTVAFSNHTGYGKWRGAAVPAREIADLFEGIAELGILPRCDAVLSGYLGHVDAGPVLLDIVGRVKAANPRALFACDPVMGDVGPGWYVSAGVPEFYRDQAIAVADIVTPNRFELEWLTGRPVTTLAETGAAAAAHPNAPLNYSSWPRTKAMPLIELEPPSSRPRGTGSARPLVLASGSAA